MVKGEVFSQGSQRIISPEIHPDHTVTFRFQAPQSHQVNINLNGELISMNKDENGVWSITTGAYDPGIYQYQYHVDGIQTIDPRNLNIKVAYGSSSLLHIPGDPPLFYEAKPVPHGVVSIHTYASKSLGINRTLRIYTPPGYSQKSNQKYPVLYLLHGGGDDERGWTIAGRAHFILDNLIADGKAKPMIVVMPHGHVPIPPNMTREEYRYQRTKGFELDLIQDVIPYVETNYRALNNSTNRALAGLSMGGGQTIHVGLTHLDTFDWLGVFSAGIFQESGEETYGPYLNNANQKLKLFWIACGKDDSLMDRNKALLTLLEKKNVRHEYVPTDGGHTWKNWRDYLHAFAQLLFQN
jgi:enterochelin esterase family protein